MCGVGRVRLVAVAPASLRLMVAMVAVSVVLLWLRRVRLLAGVTIAYMRCVPIVRVVRFVRAVRCAHQETVHPPYTQQRQ